jgi:glycogen debranching enzyme
MLPEITVGPPLLAISQEHSVLVTELDGQILSATEKGLYYHDTRLISAWQVYANGVPWELLNSGSLTYYASRVFLVNRAMATERGDVSARSLALVISRSIGPGMHEDLDLTNYGPNPVRFNLEIAIRSDFADIFEVKSGRIVRRGRITTKWSESEPQLTMSYRNRDFRRELLIRPVMSSSFANFANGRITFEVELEPAASWHACLEYDIGDGERRLSAPSVCVDDRERTQVGTTLEDWKRTVLKINTSNEEFYRLFRQAVEDMASLRLPFAGSDHMQFVPAAGVPWFVALFGRDSLIVSLQNALVYPDFARAALDILGRLQATERDDYRDAEPGKILHEMRFGELAHLKLVPHTPYYGTADATPLYLIVLHSAWCWTGDRSLLKQHLATAERCLEWIDRYGDRDGDGFQEYQTRSPVGYENQGWKDAGDSVVYPDGSLVKGPKALCELQGYVYDAWLRMADIYAVLGRADRAGELRAKAEDLFKRFNEAFWNDELGFYAFGLDGDKKQIRTISSNPGHCLASGIVPKERAGRVVSRLLEPDMWSGWGIRTLSALNPAFNPNSYQNGSVWPHDNAIIALGFKRYGYAKEAARIARDISAASSYFTYHRLPELYAGIQRNEAGFPVQYLGANVPQAWAAGSVFHLIDAIVGFQPDAANRKLYIDPTLPHWLPDLTLLDLRLGDQVFDLRFRLERDATTQFEVLRGDPRSIERRSTSAHGEVLGWGRSES